MTRDGHPKPCDAESAEVLRRAAVATGRQPMAVKHWSRAGIMITDWCNSSCACCYARCGPTGSHWMSPEDALKIWAGLHRASPHGCRVHLTGGEPFARPELLLDICRRGHQQGLALESVETNAFWAVDERVAAELLARLDGLGMGRLAISCDPYHQQYVPLQRCRRLAAVAGEILGPDRVKVRWQQWLDEGFDTAELPPQRLAQVLSDWAAGGRERFTGAAADGLDAAVAHRGAEEFDHSPCAEVLLRGKHVHVSPQGQVWPATCIGICVGNALDEPAGALWRRLSDNYAQFPVIGDLALRGPAALLAAAQEAGYRQRQGGYATKCQLCYDLRRFLHCRGLFDAYLGPDGVYAG